VGVAVARLLKRVPVEVESVVSRAWIK
jgi:hypothetical protein